MLSAAKSLFYVFLSCVLAMKNSKETELLDARNIPLREGNVSAVVELIGRLIPEHEDQILLEIDPSLGPKDKDTFLLQSAGNKLNVKGTSAIALSMGIHYYLKYFCKAHVSWSGNQLRLPQPLPKVDPPVTVTSQDKYRHYQNVCTVSYSMVWWDWPRWEKEIDWMALNGINLPLAFIAQEAIWRKVFLEYGFTDSEINEYFTGPAFLAWNRMGNIQGFGGPLSPAWHEQRVTLQKLILQRMRAFGMYPVLPAFAGRVLPAFQRVFPNSSVTKNNPWAGFKPPHCCTTILDPLDLLFVEVGEKFLREYEKEFGLDHFYSADLFNEMLPSSDPTYLTNCGKAVFQSLTDVDDQAIWIMQGWLFVDEPTFWLEPQARALLTSVPLGRMVVLDLEAEFRPQYSRYESFYGQPFIWCIIHNYGAVHGLYGSFDSINTGPYKGRSFPNSSMIGTGLTPEGIERNDVVFDLMNEMAWRDKPVDDMEKWIADYILRRYGKTNKRITSAWMHLKKSVYNLNGELRNHGKYTLSKRPSLWLSPPIWHDPQHVFTALRLMVQEVLDPELENQETYMYDLTDFTRQAFQLLFDSFYVNLIKAYTERDLGKMSEISGKMLNLLDDLDELLLGDPHFHLDSWIKNSTSWATTPEDAKLYEWNARNQITLWGPNGEIVDYANKQFGGIISGYYKQRWSLFLTTLQSDASQDAPFNQANFSKTVFNLVEEPFTRTNSTQRETNNTENSWNHARRFLQKFAKDIACVQAKYSDKSNRWLMTAEESGCCSCLYSLQLILSCIISTYFMTNRDKL